MNQEQQRIAIAEACGWKTTSDSPNWTYYRPDGRGWNGSLPDYINDLNAMHEAEKTLNNRQKSQYQAFLSDPSAVNRFLQYWPAISATAAQRAEAFLRAIGKWEDEA